MAAYIARRILLMFPTLLGILFVAFVVVQFAPGGPVERVIAQLSGADTGGTSRISGSQGGDFGGPQDDVAVWLDLVSFEDVVLREGNVRLLADKGLVYTRDALGQRTLG